MTRAEAIERLLYARQNADEDLQKEWCVALDMAIKALEQEPKTWSLDDAREDFTYDVYNTLDFLPTNDEANWIIDSFDRVTSGIKQEPILDKVRVEIDQKQYDYMADKDYDEGIRFGLMLAYQIIDKYRAGSEE